MELGPLPNNLLPAIVAQKSGWVYGPHVGLSSYHPILLLYQSNLSTYRDLVFYWSVQQQVGRSETTAPMSKEHLRQGHLTLFESHNNLRILSLNISRAGTCWPSKGLYKACLASGTPSYLISYSSKFIIPPFILHFPSTSESTFCFYPSTLVIPVSQFSSVFNIR